MGSISNYDPIASNNSTLNGVALGENVMVPSAVNNAIRELMADLAVITASEIANVPAGNIAATNIQAALNELDTEKISSGVTLTAGLGISGGGDLSANRTFDLALSELTSVIVAGGDFVSIQDITDNSTKKVTAQSIADLFDASGKADNTITLTAGVGISGGGNLTANRTFDLALSELASVTVAAGDFVAIQDITDNSSKKVTAQSIANLFDASAKLDLAGGTMTGPVRDTPNTANTGAINFSNGNNFNITPAGAITITFTNITSGQSGYLFVDNAGGHTIGFAAAAIFVGGTVPALGTGQHILGYYAPNGTDVIVTAGEDLS